MALGITVLSYVAALAFTVLFEIPYCTISSEILKLKKKPSPSAPLATATSSDAEPTLMANSAEGKKVD